MLTSIFHTGSFSMGSVFMALITTLLLGIIASSLYMLLGIYRKSFVVILTVLPLLVCTVIMIVNGNLGASVAVLGAFGLVRFRSAPGTARDIGFIFFAMAIGLATGMGFLTLAAIMTIFIGLVLIVLFKSPFGQETSAHRVLRVTIPEDLNYVGAFDDLFDFYTNAHKLVSIKTTNMGTMFELNYQITMRHKNSEKDFIDELRCRNGNLTVILGMAQYEGSAL